MGLVLTYLGILACLLCILVYVDSKGNHYHSPHDRERHHCPRNLHHKAPYEGYDWCKHGYERNFDPIIGLPKDKKRGKAIPRSADRSDKAKLNQKDLEKILQGRFSPEEEAEIIEVQDLMEKTQIKLQQFVHIHSYIDDNTRGLLNDLHTVATLIKAVKDKGTITAEEKELLTPNIKTPVSYFKDLFQAEFNKRPKAKQALQTLVREIEKGTKPENVKLRRSNSYMYKS